MIQGEENGSLDPERIDQGGENCSDSGWQILTFAPRLAEAMLSNLVAPDTHGYEALEMWLIQNEMCHKCKIHTRFRRHSKKKNVKYLINTCFYGLCFEMVVFGILSVKLISPISFYSFLTWLLEILKLLPCSHIPIRHCCAEEWQVSCYIRKGKKDIGKVF